jgi:hypothetical protein
MGAIMGDILKEMSPRNTLLVTYKCLEPVIEHMVVMSSQVYSTFAFFRQGPQQA